MASKQNHGALQSRTFSLFPYVEEDSCFICVDRTTTVEVTNFSCAVFLIVSMAFRCWTSGLLLLTNFILGNNLSPLWHIDCWERHYDRVYAAFYISYFCKANFFNRRIMQPLFVLIKKSKLSDLIKFYTCSWLVVLQRASFALCWVNLSRNDALEALRHYFGCINE